MCIVELRLSICCKLAGLQQTDGCRDGMFAIGLHVQSAQDAFSHADIMLVCTHDGWILSIHAVHLLRDDESSVVPTAAATP
jgi:hypothetical protein